jgi:YggT family protein
VNDVLCALLTAFMIVLAARAVLSWFPARPGSGLSQVSFLLRDMTEWALAPLRRIIPPAGMLDLSFLVLFILVSILRSAVC